MASSSTTQPENPEVTAAVPSATQNAPTVCNNRKSMAWEHFRILESSDPKKRRAACNYCNTEYACLSKKNGTTNMVNHINLKCRKYPYRKENPLQQTLLMKSTKERNELVPISFNQESCRNALARMLIVDELPFRHVEGDGFKRYTNILQPKFSIPSRTTIARDCLKLYKEEKKKLKSFIKGKRVCMTTDTWTSIQNLNYMCITAHFIDDEWKLHKRILSFCLVPDHTGDTIGKRVEKCLIEWEIDSLFTLTLDNASSNNTAIDFLIRNTKQWKGTILGHDYLHMRCCAHILNLIVSDGLKDVNVAVSKVRNAVRYVRSSPSRFAKFKNCIEFEKIECKSLLCLDVPTRWNSTYMMLDAAEKFQRAFDRLRDDPLYMHYFRENEGEKKRLGPPVGEDWVESRVFVKFLKIFYNATLRLSGSLNVTSNAFFSELYIIQNTLNLYIKDGDASLRAMAEKMKAKYDKYWEVDKINFLLYVAVLLDPRYKLNYLLFCFTNLYGDFKAKELTEMVTETLSRLYGYYESMYSSLNGSSHAEDVRHSSNMIVIDGEEDASALLASQYQKHLEEKDGLVNKSEVERFLLESNENLVEKFDILGWWKSNASRYPILSLVARDVLAVPVSSVASESAFSTGGRVLHPFRSSLSPDTVEALICAQDWLRSSTLPISLGESIDELEQYDTINTEIFGSALSGSSLMED